MKDDKVIAGRRGLIIVNTGNGKGKTTAALGLLLRAWGHDMKVIMLQFIKNRKANFGEHKAARRMGVEIIAGGAGFVRPGVIKNVDKSKLMARDLWEHARQKILSGDFDIVILDELSYPLQFNWLDVGDIVTALQQRPQKVHVVITGRSVPPELVAIADMVSEINEVKHHFNKGISAQPGIEY